MLHDPRFAKSLLRRSRRTWKDLRWGDEFGSNLALDEGAITQFNLRRLQQRHPGLVVKTFSTTQEGTTGADWEWWFGSGHAGWIGIAVQAKRIYLDSPTTPRYSELWRHVGGKSTRPRQIDQLLADAHRRRVFPMHVFYNGWRKTHPLSSLATLQAPIWQYGCTTGFTRRIAAATRAGHTDSYLSVEPYTWPWHWTFATLGPASGARAARMARFPWFPVDPHVMVARAFVQLREEELLEVDAASEGDLDEAPPDREIHRDLPSYVQQAMQVRGADVGGAYLDLDEATRDELPRHLVIVDLEQLPRDF